MPLQQLGYRKPSLRELHRVWNRTRRGKLPLTAPPSVSFSVPLAILHGDPLVVYGGIVPDAPLGPASFLTRERSREPAWFLLSPTWSLENPSLVRSIRRYAVLHRRRHPAHRLIFLGSTETEVELLRAAGEAAFLHNKTTHVSEQLFRPLPDVTVEFDAVYNAQLLPWKRHELAVDIARCAFLYYRSRHGYASTAASEAALIQGHLARAPAHEFLNPFDAKGDPVRLSPTEVNRHLNRAAVGLCLSEAEGAMFACVEYLLAGLPVVTTPSQGGRSFFVDEATCVTAAPNARAVADAVAALRERGWSREEVRERTLRRVRDERGRFAALVRGVYDEAGIREPFVGLWARPSPVVMRWTEGAEVRTRLRAGLADDFGQHEATA